MKEPYQCIACGFQTRMKGDMRRHFYNTKKPCPKTLNNIDLTDEIKEYILTNRIYHLPEKTPQTINQTINNYNTVNNLIANMDAIEKLTKYLDFNVTPLVEYGDTIENRFKTKVEKLADGTSDHLTLDKHSLLEVIDQVSSLVNEKVDNLNIVYDEKFNKLKLYEMGTWNESLMTSGIRTLLTKIQEFYFDQYECYLIRKIEYNQIPYQKKQVFKERLQDYYKFLGCFDIDPYTKDKNESEIMYNMDDERNDPFAPYTDENRAVPIKYTEIYNKIRDETMKSECNRIKRDVVDIIKKNSKKNIEDLNKRVVALFNMEEEFKKMMMPL